MSDDKKMVTLTIPQDDVIFLNGFLRQERLRFKEAANTNMAEVLTRALNELEAPLPPGDERFVQIAAEGDRGGVYALDAKGKVWFAEDEHTPWVPFSNKRRT